MTNITQEESLLLQCLATTSFLAELNKDNFLNKDYFEKLKFDNNDIKEILKQSGIGNPAAMQMMLYALLVVPKEIWSGKAYEKFKADMEEINLKIYSITESGTFSSYKKDEVHIDYLRHIRNAVSHAKCSYTSKDNKNYVTFEDENIKNKEEKCSIVMECYKIGIILMNLQKLIMEFYNWNHSSKNETIENFRNV